MLVMIWKLSGVNMSHRDGWIDRGMDGWMDGWMNE